MSHGLRSHVGAAKLSAGDRSRAEEIPVIMARFTFENLEPAPRSKPPRLNSPKRA